MAIQIYQSGSGCAKYGGNQFGHYESAHLWKNATSCEYFLLTYPYIYPVFRWSYRSHFGTLLTHNGSNDVFSQPLVLFAVSMITLNKSPPKNNFGHVNRHSQAKLTKYFLNVYIVESAASIPNKFFTAIETISTVRGWFQYTNNKSKMSDSHHIEKSKNGRQSFDPSAWNLAQWRILTLRTLPAVKIFNFWKHNMADGRHL